MSDKYILRNRKPVRCNDILKWGKFYESEDRVVKQERVNGAQVSTVFLGLDHQLGEGPPLVFETMIFGGEHHGFQDRYSTWEEAEAGHAKAVEMVRG